MEVVLILFWGVKCSLFIGISEMMCFIIIELIVIFVVVEVICLNSLRGFGFGWVRLGDFFLGKVGFCFDEFWDDCFWVWGIIVKYFYENNIKI